ncbi:MAG TPA: hypothetical protein VK034_14635 [Enhygromyxa sp.]|nr:hypothetical protein [Enhygromyxa sp.]
MAEPRRAKTPLRGSIVIGAAYLVQGLIAAIGVLLIGRLAQLGTPLATQGGILASGAIPWVLKFVVAVLLDLGPSWPLRIRALVLAAVQLCAAACVWGIAQLFVDGPTPSSLLAVALGWFVLNLCAASQDVIVDALALDTMAERRAAAATAMGVGVALGFNILGAWLVGGRIVAQGMAAGLSWPVWWIAAIALVPVFALWQPGRPSKARERSEQRARSPRELAKLLWIPPLFVALTLAANTTSAVSFEFLFVELGWDYPSYASLLLPIGSIASLLGALACGPLVARLGPARAALIGSALLGLSWLGFAAACSHWSLRPLIMLLAGWEGLLQSAMMVALHALALVAAARTPLPTTAFVLAMASLNLPRVLGPLVAPHAVALGWAGLFAACGLVQLLASAGVVPLRPHSRGGNDPA